MVKAKETAPVVELIQIKILLFDNIIFPGSSRLLYRVAGDRAVGIVLKKQQATANQQLQLELGAPAAALTMQ